MISLTCVITFVGNAQFLLIGNPNDVGTAGWITWPVGLRPPGTRSLLHRHEWDAYQS